MAKFTYNNSKNISTGHTLFELNYGYHPWVSFKDKFNIRSRFLSANGLAIELRKLINICRQNLLYAQELQKQAYDREVKPQSYTLNEKV